MPRLADTTAKRLALLALLVLALGCKNNPFAPVAANGGKSGGFFGEGPLVRTGGVGSADAAQKTLIAGSDAFKSQATQLERMNADLTSQLADARKSTSLLTDKVTMLQDELNTNAIRLRDSQLRILDTEKRMQTIAASTRSRAGAAISANSTTRSSLRAIEIPGVEVRQEGDVIRVSIPADQLFSPGSDHLLPSAALTLEDVARSVSQAYPKQLMSVEAFTDGGMGGGVASPHQLTASQATMVLQELTTRYRMPANQMMTVAHGANVSRGGASSFADRARSRRIELVIYPETVN